MANQSNFINIIKNAGKNIALQIKDAIDWYRGKVSNLIKAEKQRDPKVLFDKVSTPEIGKMYMFLYDAKHKDTLPYWDAHPLVFPIEFYPDGFLGINLHYLPPNQRAALLSKLVDLQNNDKYNDSTKLIISYNILKESSSRYKGFENCVKRYLFGHIRSQFSLVHSADWAKVVVLPLQKWQINPNKKYAGTPPY